MIRDRIWLLVVVLGGLAAFGKLTPRALIAGAVGAVLAGLLSAVITLLDNVFGVGAWTKLALSLIGCAGCLFIASVVFG